MHTDQTATSITDEHFLDDIIAKTLKAGATDAEIHTSDHRSLKVEVRNGTAQGAHHAEGATLQLTAYVGKRKASSGTNQFQAGVVEELIGRVVGMAKIAPEDAFCGLAPGACVGAGSDAELDLFDASEPSPNTLLDWARQLEDAACAVEGVTISDGATIHWAAGTARHFASNGLSHLSRASHHAAGAAVIAGQEANKETASCYRAARWRQDLPALTEIGREAGTMAVRKVGARKIASMQAPVIFDRRVSMSIISPLLSAISGHAIARGVSFLKDKLEQPILSSSIDIIDDPFTPRGFGSRAVDSDGVTPAVRKLVDKGVLTTWLLDCATARQLKLKTTGHGGGAYNLTLSPGAMDQSQLMREAGSGLLVSYLFGPSLNPNSGEFSVGVAGFWFENGEIAFPVSEVTVAGKLPEIYPELIAGSDLEIRSAANAPSLLIPRMSIGGI